MGRKKLAFPSWLKRTGKGLRWNLPHQLYLYEALERVTKGKGGRLIITMPPRHGKSETVTIRYVAWRLWRDPKLNVILGCYNQRLANRFSRRIRRIIKEQDIVLAKDSKAVDEWETDAGGGVKAVGVGAGITGFGGQLVMIDDPVKSTAQSDSRVYRENTWEWFRDDVYTRLEPDAAVILIQTRWHEDDLAGRLIADADETGEVWDRVDLPAIAEEDDPIGREVGAPLWHDRFPLEKLEMTRRRLGNRSFSALYQQRPNPVDGSVFRREWFQHVVASPPEGLVWARGYDLAVSKKTTADYTASFRCAFDRDDNLYIADGFRRRIEYPDQRKYIIERIKNERNTSHGIESALHGQALVQDLQHDPEVRGRPLRSVRVDGDKVTRAHGWSNIAEAGRVILVQGSWIDDFVEEACSFPHGTHDDQIDAVSLAVRMLATPPKKKSHAFLY